MKETERRKCTDRRRRRRNTLHGKNSRRFQSRSSFSHGVVESNWGQQMFRGSLLFSWPATPMKSRRLNDYDKENKREHRELSHITYQQNSTNNKHQKVSWDFQCGLFQPIRNRSRKQAVESSHHAFTVNNFHNCQVTFSVIPAKPVRFTQKFRSALTICSR